MLSALLPILQCPYCHSHFEFQQQPTPPFGAAEFGILRCARHAFPVLDGIPIIQRGPVGMFEHTRGTEQVAGRGAEDLVAMLERGAASAALIACLAVPRLPRLARRAIGWRLAHSRLAQRAARALGNRRFLRRVLSRRQDITARELFEFYYPAGGPLDPELGHYFLLRFGQPRHLAALALAANIGASPRPVLDIACGAGHLDHYLTCRSDPCSVVGLDMNFYHLWIAAHWIAPAAAFVCASAADGLPFASGAFSATLCSDAYHYIPGRSRLLTEIERCAPGAPALLTRVGNSAVRPNEGAERTVDGYLSELPAARVRVLEEAALVKCYLRRGNPLLEAPADPAGLGECKWLSFVWNERISNTSDGTPGAGAVWPHAVGRLVLNPLYASQAQGTELHLRLQFPSTHYASENDGMLAYHPLTISVDRAQIEAANECRDGATVTRLIESFVLLGAPERFLPAASGIARRRL